MESLPKHIAIIPDGNRRWARERNLDPWKGHDEGAKNIEKLVRKAFDLGIKNMSFWGSSLGNLSKRPLREKQELLKVYEEYFEKLMNSDDIHKNKAKVNVIGKWKDQLPGSLVKIIEDGISKTREYDQYNLNFFLAYSGDDEMLEAIRSIVRSGVEADNIDGDVVKSNLMTRDLPEVDYLIRTGGEPHLSAGFMMWDLADAELFFADEYFPDFGPDRLMKAIEEYKERGRRKGA